MRSILENEDSGLTWLRSWGVERQTRTLSVAIAGLGGERKMKLDFLYRITKTMTVTNEDDDAPHSFYVPFRFPSKRVRNDLQERRKTLVLRCSSRYFVVF